MAGTAAALAAASLGTALASGADAQALLAGNQANQWLAGLAFGLIGAAVLRAGGSRLGWVMASLGFLAGLATLCQQYAVLAHRHGLLLASAAAWLASTTWAPALVGSLLALPLLYPDGRLASPRWRVPAAVGAAGAGVGCLALMTTQQVLDDSGFAWARNPLDLPVADGPQLAVALVGLLVAVLVGVAAAVAVVGRMRRQSGADRVRGAWFAAAVLCGVVALAPVTATGSFALNVLSYVAIGIGIVRYGLFDIEVYLPRAIAYAVLSAIAVCGYLLVVAVVGKRTDPGLAAAAATALIALGLARVVGQVQLLVQRLLFGDRARPDAALADLGRRLAGTLHPDEVLPVTVEAVCASLRLPYAAVHLSGEDAAAWSVGSPTAVTAAFPLAHAGEDVGQLTVGLRAGERALAAADEHVLSGFARQVSVAAHGVRATRELRRSREHVVLAREAERRRIHRELHDGLGPALAGITLGLETAGRAAERDAGHVGPLLDQLRHDTSDCVDEVRRIVADLRPPVLDDLGLGGALVRQAHALSQRSGGRLVIRVTGWEDVGELPASIEAAAYRITVEAMTNCVRHAHATRCDVRIHRGSSLALRVDDDGNGRPPAAEGTGLTSMRQRADEVGGRCVICFRPGQGVLVDVELPLPRDGER